MEPARVNTTNPLGDDEEIVGYEYQVVETLPKTQNAKDCKVRHLRRVPPSRAGCHGTTILNLPRGRTQKARCMKQVTHATQNFPNKDLCGTYKKHI